MCSLEAVNKMAHIVGFQAKRPSVYRRYTDAGRPIWVTQANGQRLEPLLRELLPHLTDKREQALMLLEAFAQCPPRRTGATKLSEEQLALREGFYRILKFQKGMRQVA